MSAAGFAHILKATVRYFWFPMQHVPGGGASAAIRLSGAVILPLHAAAAVFTCGAGRTGHEELAMALLLLFGLCRAGHPRHVLDGRRRALPHAGAGADRVLHGAPVFALAARWKGGERLAWIYIVLAAAHPWALLAFA